MANNDIVSRYHLMHHGWIFFYQKHTLEKCMVMETKYVQIVVDSLKENFCNLSIFLCIEVLQSQ
jgi:hypothetical protein